MEVVTREYFLVLDRDVYKASSFAAQANRGGVVRSHYASLPHGSKIQFWMTVHIYFRGYSIAT